MKTSNDSSMLPFSGISDLIMKVDLLVAAHKMQVAILRGQLIKNNIEFKEVGEFGFMIDVALLTDAQLEVIKDVDNSLLKKVYDKIGVILIANK